MNNFFFNYLRYRKGLMGLKDLIKDEPNLSDIVIKEDPKESHVLFEFNGIWDLLETLGLDEGTLRQIMSIDQGNFEWVDYYSVREDFENGHYPTNEENFQLLRKIMGFLHPQSLGKNENTFKQEAFNFLDKTFKRQTESLVEDRTYRINSKIGEHKYDEIMEEVGHVLRSQKLYMVGRRKISMWLSDLIDYYTISGLYNKTPVDVIKDKVQDELNDLENFLYEWDYPIDDEEWRYEFNKYLEDIESRLEEDESWVEYSKLVQRLSEKFNFGVAYKLPKDPDLHFVIDSVDKEDMKIVVKLYTNLSRTERKVSEENFYHLLYQPELFYRKFGLH